MAQTDRTASSRQLAAQWSTATGVSLCASSIQRRLLSWRADWQQVVFSDESRFNLRHHDGRIRVRCYAGERHIPECFIERHFRRTPGVMVWGAIAYHGRLQLLRIRTCDRINTGIRTPVFISQALEHASTIKSSGSLSQRHLDAFTRGRIIGKLEEGRSVTSVAAELGIAHSIVSRLWRQFQTTGTATQGFSSGRPRGTTPADDRYIVLQTRRNRRQTAGEIARHTTQATGRPISRFTVARRLHGGGLFAQCPVMVYL
ncbi:transposable element Tc1 transposase [Trichonephila clavipes]|nr:transposable element Tc1 transposase [Trichonephila clavipes]